MALVAVARATGRPASVSPDLHNGIYASDVFGTISAALFRKVPVDFERLRRGGFRRHLTAIARSSEFRPPTPSSAHRHRLPGGKRSAPVFSRDCQTEADRTREP